MTMTERTTEYQPRTDQRIVEILLAHGAAPRSWQTEAADAIMRLQRDLAEARAEADRLNAYHEVWQRTRTSWEAENEKLRAALEQEALVGTILVCIAGLDLTNLERARVAARDAAIAVASKAARAAEQEQKG